MACEAVGHESRWDLSDCCGGRKILSKVTTHPFLRQRLQNLRQHEGSQCMMDWLIRTIGNTLLFPSEVSINVHECKTIEEGQMLLRELGIRESVFKP